MEGPSPGWYPDPWASGYHRYWDGTSWTGDAFPHLPTDPADQPAAPPTLPRVAPPPPDWTAAPTAQIVPPPVAPTQVLPPPPPEKPAGLSTGVFVALVVVMMLIVGSLATIGAYYAFGGRSKSSSAAPPATTAPGTQPNQPVLPGLPPGLIPLTPGTAAPAAPADPSASVLSGLVVTQADVVAPTSVQTDPDGRGVEAAATLDLCNGTYASEAARTARLQVSAYDDTGSRLLSTEAVLYTGPSDTTQGFTELKSVAAACPASSAQFKAAPDVTWPAVATVERLAFDFVETDASPTPHHVVAVYLRRGRVLMGVYFDTPDGTQASVAGQTTLAGITNVFANRMAQLPAAVTG